MTRKNIKVLSVRVDSGKNKSEKYFFIYLFDVIIFISTFADIIFNSIIIMKNGKVKFFNESKGFGFIMDSETGKEYFVHASGLIDRIRENDEVTFDLTEGKKGLNAVNVKLV